MTNQPSFDFEGPEPSEESALSGLGSSDGGQVIVSPLPALVVPCRLLHGRAGIGSAARLSPAVRADYQEQILRDLQTLRMDPVYWAPSRQFYLDRIAMYQADLDA